MPTRILIVGGGGREHALAWKLAAEPGVNEVVVAPGSGRDRATSPGSGSPPTWIRWTPTPSSPSRAADRGRARGDRPRGAARRRRRRRASRRRASPAFGPSAAAARIESSKAFCHEVAAAAGVAMARAEAFVEPARGRLRPPGARPRGDGVVIKADGLAAGKGVAVATTPPTEAVAAIDGAGRGPASRIVVEERLRGREASVIAICDGARRAGPAGGARPQAAARRRRGPNTGGMGAYSPLARPPRRRGRRDRADRPPADPRRAGPPRDAVPGLPLRRPDAHRRRAEAPRVQRAARRPRGAGRSCRGWPAPLGPLLLAAARGRLETAGGPLSRVLPGAAVGIVLAAGGYPDAPGAATRSRASTAARAIGALVFHAGTRRDDAGAFVTNGGRVLTVVGRGPDLAAARAAAESAADAISWPACSAGTTSRRPRRSRPSPREPADDPALHAAGDGRDLDRPGAVRADAPRRARRRPRPGRPRPGPARGARRDRGAGNGRRRSGSPRSSGRPTTTSSPSCRQVAESVGPEGPLPPPRADEQRRRRHRRSRSSCEPPASCSCATATGSSRRSSPRARAEADTLMMGRTHSVHAEPTTLGLKLAGWAFELDRGRRRLAAAVDEIATGKISGPVGTYSHLGPDIEAEVLAELGLHADPGEHPDRPARPPRRAAHRDRDPRRQPRALRDRDPQPPAHRDRRAPGAVQGGPEGLVGDAPQAQPDPVRADRRPRARCSAATRTRRSRTSRSGTSATSATRRPSG